MRIAKLEVVRPLTPTPMMKPFLLVFIPLFVILAAVAFYNSLLMPGGGPLPEWVIQQEERKARVFHAVTLPGRWAGGADVLVGPAVWALIPTGVFAWLRHTRRSATMGHVHL